MIFHGNAVSPGVAVGPVYVYAPQPLCARQEFAATEQIQEEGLAYAAARAKAREQLHALRQRLEKTDVEKAAIFDAHLDLTDDEVIVEEVEAEILRHGHTAEFAVQSVYGRYANVMANMADETMAQRAAAYGSLWLMLPMVSGVEDFCRAKQMLEQTRAELDAQGTGPLGDVKLGVMIETPAMVLMAKEIARRADFASIGTNDLCQYLTAADRMNPTVAPYCRSTHPALYRAIDIVARAFREEGKPICVCGELAGDVQAACVLAGLGLRKLSMSISQVAKVKRALGRHTAVELQRLAGEILACEDADEVLQCIQAALAP